MKRAAVLGAGAWGTALAKVLADRDESVELWTIDQPSADDINERRENRPFLPGIALPQAVHASYDLAKVLSGATLVVLAIPSHALREVLERARPFFDPTAILVVATKGIENESLMLMGEVVVSVAGPHAADRLAVLSGPSFAAEVARGLPTAVVAASSNRDIAHDVQHRCATERFRIYTSDDPVGVQLAGALKNVIAIAAGACEGLGFGHNARAALVTRGLAEIVRLGISRGAQPLTFAGLAGLGDLVLTCTGELSRNRTVGFELGRGRGLGEVLAGLGHVAEGVTTAKSAYELARRAGVDMPITQQVYRVLYEGKAPAQAVTDLLGRELKPEF
jgi:glycerol-3-phosphate dehydrogenase (NAD(P)+)